jgi:hypothetical protein
VTRFFAIVTLYLFVTVATLLDRCDFVDRRRGIALAAPFLVDETLLNEVRGKVSRGDIG